MQGFVRTAGVQVRIECALPWTWQLLEECCGDTLQRDGDDAATELTVRIEDERDAFPTSYMSLLSRSCWTDGASVVVRDVCTSGFDMRLSVVAGQAIARYRWRPPHTTRAAAIVLRARFRLLVRAALLQYPAMWWASTRGCVPLHAPVCSVDGTVMLLAGPAGVGKTTLLMRELRGGAMATSDNLCVTDGRDCWGVLEPVRVEGVQGKRSTHGRRETSLPNRVESLTPDLVLVLRRGNASTVGNNRCSAEDALRTLVGGTYMAGELRRYWGFAATLSTGTGCGPVHPPITDVAERLTRRLPCVEVAMPSSRTFSLHDVLGDKELLTCA
jgi:hypothetical protein